MKTKATQTLWIVSIVFALAFIGIVFFSETGLGQSPNTVNEGYACRWHNYNFKEPVSLEAQQGWIGNGEALTRYYDFESSNEVLNGIHNLIDNEGSPTFTTNNALLGKSGRVAIDNNWRITGDEDINLGSGPDKSLNLWIRAENIISGRQVFLWKGSTGTLRLMAENRLFDFKSVISGAGSQGPASNYQWHMITIVRQGTQATIYIDGEFAETGFSALVDSIEDHYIGVESGGLSELVGLFDEMSWWNVSLTQEDIELLYNNGNGRRADSFVGGNGLIETSERILIPLELKYEKFEVLEADLEGTCTGTCSYSINNIDCGDLSSGANHIPQQCLDTFDESGFHDIEISVDENSAGSISELALRSRLSSC